MPFNDRIDLSSIRPWTGLMVLAVTALAGCASTPDSSTATANCASWTTRDYADARVIRKFRVYTNRATGDSAIEDTTMTPSTTPLLKTGKLLVQYNFGPSSKTQIVYGPPNLSFAPHPSPGLESFLILQGSATLTLNDGTKRELVPGDMTTYEDTDASHGHGGATGPCGYVALQIVP